MRARGTRATSGKTRKARMHVVWTDVQLSNSAAVAKFWPSCKEESQKRGHPAHDRGYCSEWIADVHCRRQAPYLHYHNGEWLSNHCATKKTLVLSAPYPPIPSVLVACGLSSAARVRAKESLHRPCCNWSSIPILRKTDISRYVLRSTKNKCCRSRERTRCVPTCERIGMPCRWRRPPGIRDLVVS